MLNSVLAEQLVNLRMAGPKSAPRLHKPLLVGILLKRFIRDGSTSATFTSIEKELEALIGRFAPSKSPPRPQYPFWRLREDGFWEIDNANQLEVNNSGDPRISDLRREDYQGRWTIEATRELRTRGGEMYLGFLTKRYFRENSDAVLEALSLEGIARP